jgi:anti-sigma factor RsiW
MSAARNPERDRLLKVMAYADGELDGPERAEVERWLATDPDAARFANDLAALGDLVELGHGGSPDARAIASFDVADVIMTRVGDAAPAAVVPLDAARARRRTSVRVGGGLAAALALAASVFLMTRHRDEQPLAHAPARPVQASPPPSEGPGVDVDLVQTPGRSVSVFYLPSETNLTTSVVVWVDETGEK